LGIAISDYVWDHTDSHILVDDSLKKLQRVLDLEYIRSTADSFFRTTERTALFQSELRAICKCKTIKEELMAETWHPRRVERILETYGWDAYNNLLGEE
jgi:hypothetical protein